jgi:hypothetical protein
MCEIEGKKLEENTSGVLSEKNFASLDFHFISRNSLQFCTLLLALDRTIKVSVQNKENRRFRNHFLLSTHDDRCKYNHSYIRKQSCSLERV